jgi:DNA-binding response OmpR family regulator
MSAATNGPELSIAGRDLPVSAFEMTEPFTLGDWRIDPPLRRASKGETVVKIDPRNLRVLQILAERRGQLVSQREIETIAWEGVIVTPDSLYQSIRQLRQALGDTKSPRSTSRRCRGGGIGWWRRWPVLPRYQCPQHKKILHQR